MSQKPIVTGPILHKLILALVFAKIIEEVLSEHVSGHVEEKTMTTDSSMGMPRVSDA